MMTKKSAFVILFLLVTTFVLIVSFLSASCFLLDRNSNSEAFVSGFMLLCVLTYTRAQVDCGRVWHVFFLCTNSF
jgi:hypothetical protein